MKNHYFLSVLFFCAALDWIWCSSSSSSSSGDEKAINVYWWCTRSSLKLITAPLRWQWARQCTRSHIAAAALRISAAAAAVVFCKWRWRQLRSIVRCAAWQGWIAYQNIKPRNWNHAARLNHFCKIKNEIILLDHHHAPPCSALFTVYATCH